MADCCSGGTKLLYSCSGSADVGKLADLVSRKLRDDGYARMTCLAGVGADLSGFIASAQGADENITIDGCSQECARKGLERIGVTPRSIVLTEMGCEKGKTTVTENLVSEISSRIKFTASSVSPGSASGGCGCGGKC
jgi:uncharacterized metal-binding protein